jgi:hypothetical protein
MSNFLALYDERSKHGGTVREVSVDIDPSVTIVSI